MKSTNTSTPKIVGAVVMVSIIAIAAYVFVLSGSDSKSTVASTSSSTVASTQNSSQQTATNSSSAAQPTTQQANTNTTSSTSSTPVTSNTSGIKDGTYSSSTDYSVPKGETNSISVTLTVKDGNITSVSTQNDYTDHESAQFISSFKSSLSSKVVGKALKDFAASRIGGASLTTDAFNEAVSQIAQNAS